MDDTIGTWSFVSGLTTKEHMTGSEFSSTMFSMFLGVGRQFAQEQLEITLQRLVDAAKDIIAAGGHIRSGQLYDSIQYVIFPGGLMGAFGSDVYYAKYVNYGTSRMTGIHFLEGAVDSVRI